MAIKMPNMWSFECIVILTTVHTIFKDLSEIKVKSRAPHTTVMGELWNRFILLFRSPPTYEHYYIRDMLLFHGRDGLAETKGNNEHAWFSVLYYGDIH